MTINDMDNSEPNKGTERAVIQPTPPGRLPNSARVIDGYVQIDALAQELNVSVAQLKKDIKTAEFNTHTFGGYQYINRSELANLPPTLFKKEDDRRNKKREKDKERRLEERTLIEVAKYLKETKATDYENIIKLLKKPGGPLTP